MLKRFNEAFGLQDSVETERSRFVNRITESLFHTIDEQGNWLDVWVREVCVVLGMNLRDIGKYAESHQGRFNIRPEDLAQGDFDRTLRVICALYEVLSNRRYQVAEWVDSAVKAALSRATVDIGVRWHDGMFFPTGAELLDEKLLVDPYRWLDAAPEAKTHFRKAVTDFATSRFPDSVAASYNCLEQLTTHVLGNGRNLENNKTELLQRLALPSQWGSILNNLLLYANETARHANKPGAVVTPNEAEAFLYQTGLMVRLILNSKNAAPAA